MSWQGRSKRKYTGGKHKKNRKRRIYEKGRDFLPLVIGEVKRKKNRVRGGGEKLILLSHNKINVTDLKTGITKNVEIKTVTENSANPHFVRRNIITKGAIIETELGKAKVTSRPGQNGVLNGILIE
ncbi:MAG: 30S ribosomal protein S8e [Candidatus Methanoliparum thermophilum]|uniref:Small ribosomal subunit protein eS8 n=1 Tax=Methanoliparum thermophilum TaxID=2491083 RepID=A0A520KS00_METT2|nr:30S ribosomal protein S8e [Candidatus Methanoliparum sp. LAM-1]RZN64562.1 MAG: 30S ribosomal protein S8e [Candidatus Methanoliparum thermophilum]BDC35839.1 30S ribosomal protein S8e [Candidatus Methanoliparum sp. LAM-1]